MNQATGLGERMRRLRLERRLTQQEVAQPAYSPAYVSTIEAGRRAPSPAAIEHFARKLGVTTDELVRGIPSWFEPEARLQLQEGWRALYLGRYSEAKKAFAGVEKQARRFGRAGIQAQAIIGSGWCAEREGQTADALRLFSEALQLLEREAPLPAHVEAVAGIARCHQMSGKARLAAHILEGYLLELERQNLREPGALMRTYASLVWPYMELGLYEKAADVAQQALKLQSRVDDPQEIAGMHLNVARVLMNEAQVDAALESLKKAEDIFTDLNWRTEVARARTNRGMVYISEGELAKARDELHSALETFQEVGFVRGEARTLNELARVERLLGKAAAAEELARKAVQLLSDMEAVPELALAHRELALNLRSKAPKEAEKHFRRAIELYRECGEVLHAADTHRLLGDLLTDTASADRACAEYRAGLLAIVEQLDRKD